VQTNSTKATVVADADNRHPKLLRERLRFKRNALTNPSIVTLEDWHANP
jgi:hypothetical protein